MDDFGTGYSSLAYLVRFPLDIIKIDRSLVAGMESNEQQRMVVSAVVTLGAIWARPWWPKVETTEQLQLLREMECSQFQGFGLSVPLSEGVSARPPATRGGLLWRKSSALLCGQRQLLLQLQPAASAALPSLSATPVPLRPRGSARPACRRPAGRAGLAGAHWNAVALRIHAPTVVRW
jgi:hypothetical protein